MLVTSGAARLGRGAGDSAGTGSLMVAWSSTLVLLRAGATSFRLAELAVTHSERTSQLTYLSQHW